ncbi:MAG: nucleoside recognition domain-containing protein [Halanaerobiales bacterium]
MMINFVWLILICSGIIMNVIMGNGGDVSNIILQSALSSVELSIKLLGPMIFWLGIMNIARKAKITNYLAHILGSFFHMIFPELKDSKEASGAIIMNMAANLLGMGNSATPLGIKAMTELQKINKEPERASPSMCTLLALNTSSITILPLTVITMRAAAGSLTPSVILVSTFFATFFSTVTALIFDRFFRIYSRTKKDG